VPEDGVREAVPQQPETGDPHSGRIRAAGGSGDHPEGDRLIIEPVHHKTQELIELLAPWAKEPPLEDELPETEDPPTSPEGPFD
jgi:hypothetical protein